MKLKLVFLLILLTGCTFGKVANSQVEKEEELGIYLSIIRALSGSVAFRLYSFDDQGDVSLNTFTSADLNGTYNINLSAGAASLDRIEFSIQQGLLNISQPNLHVTGSTATGSTIYTAAQNAVISNFLVKNSDILTGPANLFEFNQLDNVVHSTVQTVTIHFRNLQLSGTIAKAGTQNISIDTGVIDVPVTMSCQPLLNSFTTLKMDIGFKFSELFKNGQTVNFITALYNSGGGTTIVNSTTNITLYNEIIYNLKKPGTLFLQSCQ